MSQHSIAARTSSGTAAAAALEIIATGPQVKVTSIKIALAAATASTFGIGIPAAVGITPTTPAGLISEDRTQPAIALSTALAWGTGPTVPAQFFRRVYLAAVLGESITLSFPDGITLANGQSLVVWNIGTNGIADVTITAAN